MLQLAQYARIASSQNRTGRRAFTCLGIFVILMLAVSSAHAGCGSYGQKSDPIKFPAEVQGANSWGDSIVGLWHVTYTVGDTTALFGVSLKEWHSDGTEFENIDHSPIIGNVCFGVWRLVSPRCIHLHHTGWTFDDSGAPTGSFIIEEVDNIAANGLAYSGSFTFKVYDTNGDYVSGSEVTGKIAAARITVN